MSYRLGIKEYSSDEPNYFHRVNEVVVHIPKRSVKRVKNI